MSSEQTNRLDRILEHIQQEADSLDSLVARGKAADDELWHLLATAQKVKAAIGPPAPSPEFIRNTEVRLLNLLRSRKVEPPRLRAPKLTWRLARVRLLAGLLVVVTLIASTIGVGSASAAALPGDGLYPVKRGIEEARLILTIDPEEDVRLLGEFADERLRELEGLAQAGRTERLEEAVGEYDASVDQWSQATEQFPELSEEIQTKYSQHVAVLEGVLAQVPIQAQEAIQRAIDRSLEQATRKEERRQERINRQEDNAELPEERREQQEQEQNLRRAEQIAKQYGVAVDQVLQVFEGTCGADWKCVRDYFRVQGPGKGKPNK